jgi:Bles03-like protein
LISAGTVSGNLGYAAREADPNDGSSTLVVFVHTYDFEDFDDVLRVLGHLRAIGFGDRLVYRADEDARGRPYEEEVTIYVSDAGSSSFSDIRVDPMSH